MGTFGRYPCCALAAVAIMAVGPGVAANDVDGGVGAAGPGHASTALPPAGLDDAYKSIRETVGLGSGEQPSDSEAQEVEPVEQIPISTQLESLAVEDKSNALIELELQSSAAPEHVALAELVQEQWRAGQYEAAIAVMRSLESMGVIFDMGLAWKTPRPLNALDGTDVLINGARSNATKLELDHKDGNLFAVVLWQPSGATHHWTMNFSSDGGSTWAETYDFFSGSGLTDADMIAVDDYAYVEYVSNTNDSEARIRRCLTSTGLIDAGYGFHVWWDVSPNTVVEVAAASNADDFDNRIYYFLIQSNGVIRFAFDVASDGTTPTASPTGISNASSGLDATWDNNFTCATGRFFSYFDTGGSLRVYSHDANTGVFALIRTITGAATGDGTSISAYGYNVFVAYGPSVGGIEYQVSRTCGSAPWLVGALQPSGNYGDPTITARGGWGTAIVYWEEAGTQDPLWVQCRRNYGTGPWTTPVQTNDFDVFTGVDTEIEFLPPVCGGPGFGLAYVHDAGQVPYFDGKCPNDDCAEATQIGGNASASGDITFANNDGTASCGASATNNDVWFRFDAPRAGHLLASTCGTHDTPAVDLGMDTVLAAFRSCGGTELACDDDWDERICETRDTGVRRDSAIRFCVAGGQSYWLRVSHFGGVIRDGEFVIQTRYSCRADTNFDGTVDVLDLLNVLTNWGPCGINNVCTGDVNCDGTIDVLDLLDVLTGWGPC